MHNDPLDVNEVVAQLEGADTVKPAYALIDRYAREGRISELVELWRAVEAGCHVEGNLRWPYASVADRVEDTLATLPGAESLRALLTLITEPRTRSVRATSSESLERRNTRLGWIAARLGQQDRAAELVEVLGRPGHAEPVQELVACWMHEAILRGAPLEAEPSAVAFRARLEEQRHPLAWLPLARLDLELDAANHMPRFGDAAYRVPDVESEVVPAAPPAVSGPFGSIVRIAARDEEQLMEEAIRLWTEGSNGHSEAKVFEIGPPIVHPTGPIMAGKSLLRVLPLDCMAEAAEFKATRVGARTVWNSLLGAASGGGAYTSGPGGAYSRRTAWRSFRGLIGAPADAGPLEIQAASSACSFAAFTVSSSWFYTVAWDLGIMAVRQDGRTVAVLAASDTD